MRLFRYLCFLAIEAASRQKHRALMLRVRDQRDRVAFRELATHFGPRIRHFLLARGAAATDVDEVCQEVLLVVWTKAASYDPARAAVSTWIFTIARNRWIDRTRRTRRFEHQPDDPAWVPSDPETPEEAYDTQEREKKISAAVQELPDDQRDIVRRVYFEGQTQRAVAETLGVPLGTVKSRIRLSLQRLRGLLRDESPAQEGA